MLSLLFSVLGVYLFVKCKWGFVAAPFLFCASLAIYQAYFQVAVLLLMMLFVFDILDGYSFQRVIKRSQYAVGTLFLGLIIYYVFNKAALAVTGITPADSYNGLQIIGDYSSESIPFVFVKTYLHVARSFIIPETFNMRLTAIINVIIILSVLAMLVRLSAKRSIETKNKVLLALIIVAMPFGANVVYFIAKFMHSLMTYSFVLFYLFALMLSEYTADNKTQGDSGKTYGFPVQTGAMVLGAIILFNGVIYSNQIYFRKELEYQATTAVMNRVVSSMERVEGYVAGETPVAFAGRLDQSNALLKRSEFDHLTGVGLQSSLAVTYYSTYGWYLELILGYPVNLLSESSAQNLASTSEVRNMPAFPKPGYCQMVDGTLVVKLSEGWTVVVDETKM